MKVDEKGRFLKIPHDEYIEKVKKRLKDSVLINENGCWIWQKQLHYHYPYGITTFTENGKKSKQPAHRVSYKLWKGPIPENMYILHQCDEARCINPEHLEVGTQKENLRQMRERGRANDISRGRKGIKHGMAKLTESDVLEIRKLREKGWSGPKLADKFKVNNTLIYFICKRLNWSHI